MPLQPDPDPGIAGGVLHGVAQEVLHDPSHHGRIGGDREGSHVERQATSRHELGVGDELADERPEVELLERRGRDAPVEPLEIEEVAHDAVELPGVRGDPVGHVARLDRFDLEIFAFEGDGEAEDRGERRAEVVRHGLQERGLHLVLEAEPFGLVALALERPRQLEGAALLGHVDEDAEPVARAPVLIEDQRRLIVDPDGAPVLRDDAVGAGGGSVDRRLGLQDRAIVRVDDAGPKAGLRVPLGRGVAEHRLHLGADVDRRPLVDRVDVHDRRGLLHERPVARLRLRRRAPRLHAGA